MFSKREPLKKIWVLCGGPSVEHEVSLSSGKVVCERIGLTGRQVWPVVITRHGKWNIAEKPMDEQSGRDGLEEFFAGVNAEWDEQGVGIAEALRRMLDENVDCAFLVFHGDFGEDGGIQGFLQTAGIPFTGSGILGSSVALNKAVALATFDRIGIRVARSVRVSHQTPNSEALAQLKFPVFTKPVRGGSSIGVTLVRDAAGLQHGIDEALAHDREALVEEKIEGVEVSCGVLDLVEKGGIRSQAMPPTLICPLEAEFFDYEAKYVPGKSKDTTPAPLPEDVILAIQDMAMRAHHALCCEGMSRTDMIVKDQPGAVPTVLETQTIPGMTPTSLLPQQCAAAGISFEQFIDHLITHSLFRAGRS